MSTNPQPPARPAADTAEPRQRWRLAIRRRPDAEPLTQARWQTAWEASLAASGLPVAWTATRTPRPRLIPALPLPVDHAAERELVDLYLTRRLMRWQVREALEPMVPRGHELVDLHDVWLGAPGLPGQVAATEYLVRLPADEELHARLLTAVDDVLSATRLDRRRERGERVIAYDLRPQILALSLGSAPSRTAPPGTGVSVTMQLRHDPERGPGRPEEVLRELGERAGRELRPASMVRTRVLLVEDLEPGLGAGPPHRAPEPDDTDS